MFVPPTKEAYEALLKRVEVLEERNKRLRNVTSTPKVELQPEPRDRKASRNSWAEVYKEHTDLRKNTHLFGNELEVDDGLERRVKLGQLLTGVCAYLGLTCWIAQQFIPTVVFFVLIIVFSSILYYKNVSFVIAKRLLRETKVVSILMLSLFDCVIDIVRPTQPHEWVIGIMYMLLVVAFVFVDAIKIKSRMFVLGIGSIFVLLNMFEIYSRTFLTKDHNVILYNYYMQGKEYKFMKRDTKRSIFIQIMLFSMNGIYTIFNDRKQELMIFATGHIYRKTGTASKEVEDKQYSMKIKLEENVV
jgi:hypothetical protein